MQKRVARLLVRSKGAAGLVLTIDMEPGIYEIVDIMGVLTVKYIGQPHMHTDRYNTMSVEQLLGDADAILTTNEKEN